MRSGNRHYSLPAYASLAWSCPQAEEDRRFASLHELPGSNLSDRITPSCTCNVAHMTPGFFFAKRRVILSVDGLSEVGDSRCLAPMSGSSTSSTRRLRPKEKCP